MSDPDRDFVVSNEQASMPGADMEGDPHAPVDDDLLVDDPDVVASNELSAKGKPDPGTEHES